MRQQRRQRRRARALGDGFFEIAIERDRALEIGLLDQQHFLDQMAATA